MASPRTHNYHNPFLLLRAEASLAKCSHNLWNNLIILSGYESKSNKENKTDKVCYNYTNEPEGNLKFLKTEVDKTLSNPVDCSFKGEL